jgi:hypothetical protein
VEYEQGGKLKAEYGKALLENLAKDLSIRYGRGFSRSNLNYMRLLYGKYPKCETLSHKLSWSHYYELLKVEDDLSYNNKPKQPNLTPRPIQNVNSQTVFNPCFKQKTGMTPKAWVDKSSDL